MKIDFYSWSSPTHWPMRAKKPGDCGYRHGSSRADQPLIANRFGPRRTRSRCPGWPRFAVEQNRPHHGLQVAARAAAVVVERRADVGDVSWIGVVGDQIAGQAHGHEQGRVGLREHAVERGVHILLRAAPSGRAAAQEVLGAEVVAGVGALSWQLIARTSEFLETAKRGARRGNRSDDFALLYRAGKVAIQSQLSRTSVLT